jgi:hypothetical protein
MKLQSLTIGSVIMALGIVGVTAMGCTATASGGATVSSSGGRTPPGSGSIPSGCAEDSTLTCSSDAIGISCPAGTAPDDPTLECSDPTPAGSSDGYCCIQWVAGGDCTPDGTVTGCDYPSYGFSCTAGAAPPDAADGSITCSTATPSGSEDLYCCVDNYTGSTSSSSGTSGCVADSSLACDAGSDGVDCSSSSDNPESDFPGYICSDPSPQGDGTIGYCCATGFSGSTCAQDDSVTGCAYPSVGFSCTGTDTPDQADSSLTCSDPTTDPNTGDQLYCCQ